MISIYKKNNNSSNATLVSLKKVASGCWINVINPSDDEIKYSQKNLVLIKMILMNFLIMNQFQR